MDPTLPLLWVALYVAGLVLAIAWLVVPFALIGTKPLLRKLLDEQRVTNTLLQSLRDEARR